ncbi:MAG: glutaredoxin domain-containing protein [Planctomycetota bacterium]
MIEWIDDVRQFDALRDQHEEFFVLAFLGDFSEAARRARRELETFAARHDDVPVLAVDVAKVKNIHGEYDVERVPTVLAVENGEVDKSVEGVQSARFYGLHFAGAAPSRDEGAEGKPNRTVVVYSSPGCPACTQLKNYLRRNGVSYRSVDISRDQRAAQKLVRRSGNMAVPQTDIDGQLVVGFDRPRLNRLLGIQQEEEA